MRSRRHFTHSLTWAVVIAAVSPLITGLLFLAWFAAEWVLTSLSH